MSVPFNVGDVVVCVRGNKSRYSGKVLLEEGRTYTISEVMGEYVRVAGSNMDTIFPDRFKLAAGSKTKVERKIKQMEQRFIKHQQEKKNESMCCL